MNYHKIEKTSIANGIGIRVVLWCSGCSCCCPGCHNKETWDRKSGKAFMEYDKNILLESLSKDYIQGITFSGGHPLEPYNVEEVYSLCKEIREKLPNKDIWLYTGYVLNMDNFTDDSVMSKVLNLCDVIVDGPFIESEKDIRLKWRGSTNQRVIDVKKTLANKEISLWEERI